MDKRKDQCNHPIVYGEVISLPVHDFMNNKVAVNYYIPGKECPKCKQRVTDRED